MTIQHNATDFVAIETRKFSPAFEGAQARREMEMPSLMARRHARRDRRANRAL